MNAIQSDNTMKTWKELKTPEKCYIAARAADGRTMTADALAHEIGRFVDGPAPTRNAVIGLIRRHEPEGVTLTRSMKQRKDRSMARSKLVELPKVKPDRTSKPYQSTRVKEAAGLRTAPKHTPRLPQVHLPALRSLELPLVELKPGQCRYPTNDPAPFEGHLFCGHPVKEGSSYCSCHHAVCFNGFGKTDERRAAA